MNTVILNPKKFIYKKIGRTVYTFYITESRIGLLNRVILEVKTHNDYKRLSSRVNVCFISVYDLIRQIYKDTTDHIVFAKFNGNNKEVVNSYKKDLKILDKLLESEGLKSIAHDDLSLYK